jgi:FAD/FMN-containing dehydrogenase
MIDVSLMKAVQYDPNTKKVRVQGGDRNKQVFEACEKLDVAITHGRFYEVGVAGLTLGVALDSICGPMAIPVINW